VTTKGTFLCLDEFGLAVYEEMKDYGWTLEEK
jgi:hypothetical protein